MITDMIAQTKLGKLETPVKLFLTTFLLVMALGYLMAVFNVQQNIGLSAEGVVNHYRGSEKDPAAYPGMDLPTLVSTTHTHLFSMSFIFFLLGMVFIFTTTLGRLKYLILAGSFLLIPLDLGSAWLVKFVTPGGAYLMLCAGALVGTCVLFETVTPLYEMWVRKTD